MKTAMNKLWVAMAAVALTIVEIVIFAAFVLLLGGVAIALGVARLVTAVRRPFSRSSAGVKPQMRPQSVVVWQQQHV